MQTGCRPSKSGNDASGRPRGSETGSDYIAQAKRSDRALTELQAAYGRLCASVAGNILRDRRDVEECVNDAILRVWNVIPPERPASLAAFLSRIARNLALDRYSYNTAEKRNTALVSAFEELEPFLTFSENDVEKEAVRREFSEFLNRFLAALPRDARIFFVRRYWYGESIRQIAEASGAGEERIKSSLFRTRNKLREAMGKETISL